MIRSFSRATVAETGDFGYHSLPEINAALAVAPHVRCFWRRKQFPQRVLLLRSIACVLPARKTSYLELITKEMGKPFSEAGAKVEKCVWSCDLGVDQAPGFLADEVVASHTTESMVVSDPLGVVLAIMPWNCPFWLFFRFTAGTFAAHRIAAVTRAGSREVGAIIALWVKVLELSGSDPFLLLADANVKEGSITAFKARYRNIRAELHQRQTFPIGWHRGRVFQRPTHFRRPEVEDRPDSASRAARRFAGPSGTVNQRGGTCEVGRHDGIRSWFSNPTTVSDKLTPRMTAFREEMFDPIAAIKRMKDESETAVLTNCMESGLCENLWTNDVGRGKMFARQIDVGAKCRDGKANEMTEVL